MTQIILIYHITSKIIVLIRHWKTLIDNITNLYNLHTFHHLSPQCHQSKLEIFLKSSVLVFQITLNSVSRDNLCWAPTFTWVGGKKLLLSAQKTAFCILHFIFCLLLFGFHILHLTFYIHHFTSFTRGHIWREKAGEERCERQWCTCQ